MSFNYTDTLEKVYGIKDVLHLHGGIPSCCEIAPIMGHGNKYIIDLYRRKAKEAQEDMLNGMKAYVMQLLIFVSRCIRIRMR